MTAHSAMYEGTIRHRRFRECTHEFRHRIAMAYVDLDELPRLLQGKLVRRRPGIVRFRRADYLGDAAIPLADAVRAQVAERTGRAPQGPIRVLTQLRTFGHCFNPVSLYYCFAPDGERLEAIVAEVTSTPWDERHAYVLTRGDGDHAILGGTFAKQLHVSPFMAMDQRYAWRATEPGPARPTLSVHIESVQDGVAAFDATLGLRRRRFSRRVLAGATARHPAATVRLLVLIYAHAVALRLKGVRVKPHPGPQPS